MFEGGDRAVMGGTKQRGRQKALPCPGKVSLVAGQLPGFDF